VAPLSITWSTASERAEVASTLKVIDLSNISDAAAARRVACASVEPLFAEIGLEGDRLTVAVDWLDRRLGRSKAFTFAMAHADAGDPALHIVRQESESPPRPTTARCRHPA